jgi:hypothetical protein
MNQLPDFPTILSGIIQANYNLKRKYYQGINLKYLNGISQTHVTSKAHPL